MMTKQEVLNKLQVHPENDYSLWNNIAELLAELGELERLQTYAIRDAERGISNHWPRLHELEVKFGV